jgi:hypothetical protein
MREAHLRGANPPNHSRNTRPAEMISTIVAAVPRTQIKFSPEFLQISAIYQG